MNGDNYRSYAAIIWDALDSGEREVLNQLLHTGPVWDGNIVSKSSRDSLIGYKLAVRCCCYGEDGYTAASYTGKNVFKAGKAEPFTIKEPTRG